MSKINLMLVLCFLGFLVKTSLVFAAPATLSDATTTTANCQSFKDKDRIRCEAIHNCFIQFQDHLKENYIEQLYACARSTMQPDMHTLHFEHRLLESPMQRFVQLMKPGQPNRPGKFGTHGGEELGCEVVITDSEPQLYQKLSNPPLQSRYQNLLVLLLELYWKDHEHQSNGQTLADSCFWQYLGAGQYLFHRNTGSGFWGVFTSNARYDFNALLEQMFYCRRFTSVCVEPYMKSLSSSSKDSSYQFYSCTRDTFTKANPVRILGRRLSTVPLVPAEPSAGEAVVKSLKKGWCYFFHPADWKEGKCPK